MSKISNLQKINKTRKARKMAKKYKGRTKKQERLHALQWKNICKRRALYRKKFGVIKGSPWNNTIIIGFESSGPHDDSFPTEVAWMNPFTDEEATSHLVRPTIEWQNSKWDDETESITGITKKLLIKKGAYVKKVAKNIYNATCHMTVLSTTPERDMRVLTAIYNEHGMGTASVYEDGRMIRLEPNKFNIYAPKIIDYYEYAKSLYIKEIPFDRKISRRAKIDVERLSRGLSLGAMS